MRKVLIIGSGKSSSYLIKYLLDKSKKESLFITIADKDITNTKLFTYIVVFCDSILMQ